MREILIKAGKDFVSNRWCILFGNKTHNFSFDLQEGFEQTMPYPGIIMDEEGIRKMIDFLLQTLQEREENEQSDLE